MHYLKHTKSHTHEEETTESQHDKETEIHTYNYCHVTHQTPTQISHDRWMTHHTHTSREEGHTCCWKLFARAELYEATLTKEQVSVDLQSPLPEKPEIQKKILYLSQILYD